VRQPPRGDEAGKADEQRGVQQALGPEDRVTPTLDSAQAELDDEIARFLGRYPIDDGFPVYPGGRPSAKVNRLPA